MRLSQKLVLFVLAMTLLPLAVVGFGLLRSFERELQTRIAHEQRAVAVAVAEGVSSQLLGAINAVARSAELIDWAKATPEELRGALSLLYQQSNAVSAVALVDAQGKLLAEPVFLPEGGSGHPGFHKRGLEGLLKALPLAPLAQGGRGQAALSPAYPHSLGQLTAVAIAVKLAAGPDAPFALAELVTQSLEELVTERASRESGRVEVADGEGRVLVSSQKPWVLNQLQSAVWERVKTGYAASPVHSFTLAGPPRQLVSAAALPALGLHAVVSVDEAIALAPVLKLRQAVLGAIGGALAVFIVVALAFSRHLTGRLAVLARGAEALGKGDLATRLKVSGADELTDVADAFNRMGAELETARGRLLRWNDELKLKVDEATADLRAAQAQLVEAQKLAAVGQLGAGVAHEINNPLAGILGNAQLLMLERSDKDPDFESLKKIEQSAKRCKEITQNLLRFSQLKDRGDLRPVDLNSLVRDAVALSQNGLREEGVSVELNLQATPLMVLGDPGHLAQVVQAFVANARTAMLKTELKKLQLVSRGEGAEVIVEVKDTGKGIRPEHLPRIFEPFFTTKDVWSNVGLGLSVAYRVVTEHGGRIEVDTQVDTGSTFRLRLPTEAAARTQAPQARQVSPASPGALV
jgi:C4-dicarboxylate-specific signal transduction histidine kinase